MFAIAGVRGIGSSWWARGVAGAVVGALVGCGDGEGEREVGRTLEEVEAAIAAFEGAERSPKRFALECRAARALFEEGRLDDGAVRYMGACTTHAEPGTGRYPYRASLEVIHAAIAARAEEEHVHVMAFLAAEAHPQWREGFEALAARYRLPWRASPGDLIDPERLIRDDRTRDGLFRDWPDAWLFPDERPTLWDATGPENE